MRKSVQRRKYKGYSEFREILFKALDAGEAAAVHARERASGRGMQRGTVHVQLNDGRSAFARYLRELHPEMWKYVSRRTGVCYQVPEDNFDVALSYAEAMQTVLSGGVPSGTTDVTIVTQQIDSPEVLRAWMLHSKQGRSWRLLTRKLMPGLSPGNMHPCCARLAWPGTGR